MESFAIYILTYKIKYAKLCENKFLSHFAFLLLALIFRWLSWKLKYTLYLISWVYNVEDSCQIMHHCQSRNQADAETIFTINYLLITKFWEAFSYLPLSEELISGDQIWLDGKNRIAQPKGSIINNLFRFEDRKHTSLPQHSMARCGWWLVAQFLVPQTPLLFCEAAQHSQFIIYAECIIFPSRCSWQLLSNINTPTYYSPPWLGRCRWWCVEVTINNATLWNIWKIYQIPESFNKVDAFLYKHFNLSLCHHPWSDWKYLWRGH